MFRSRGGGPVGVLRTSPEPPRGQSDSADVTFIPKHQNYSTIAVCLLTELLPGDVTVSSHSADLKTSVINMIWTTSPENLRSSNSDSRRPVKHKSNKLQMCCVYWNGFTKSSCSFRKILQLPCWFLMQRHLRGRRSQVTSVGVMTS